MGLDHPHRANPNIVLREESDGYGLLFDPDTGSVVGINPVGIAIWGLLDGQRTTEEITRHLRESFDGTPEALSDQVEAFLASLLERGYISPGEP